MFPISIRLKFVSQGTDLIMEGEAPKRDACEPSTVQTERTRASAVGQAHSCQLGTPAVRTHNTATHTVQPTLESLFSCPAVK